MSPRAGAPCRRRSSGSGGPACCSSKSSCRCARRRGPAPHSRRPCTAHGAFGAWPHRSSARSPGARSSRRRRCRRSAHRASTVRPQSARPGSGTGSTRTPRAARPSPTIATGAKAATGSYGRRACVAAEVRNVDEVSSSTEPSCGALATASEPITPARRPRRVRSSRCAAGQSRDAVRTDDLQGLQRRSLVESCLAAVVGQLAAVPDDDLSTTCSAVAAWWLG